MANDTRPSPSITRRRLEAALLGGGALLLLGVGAVYLDARWAQRLAAASLRAPAAVNTAAEGSPAPGSPVARLVSPELDLDVVALEGVDPKALRRGVGHLPGTALPGSTGNASFAGHRDTFFRGLRAADAGQRIRLETAEAVYVYEITGTRIVEPSAVEVVGPLPGGSFLTLVTCYPFDWIGPAPQRFVVRASLVDRQKLATLTGAAAPAAAAMERSPQ